MIRDVVVRLRTAAFVLLAAGSSSSAGAETRTAFVTSTTGTGKFSTWAETELNGLAGADEICQARANAEELGGTYRAWISTDQTDAYCHLFNQIGSKPICASSPNPATMGPWVRTDGTPFAANLSRMVTQHEIYQPALFDETGAEIPDPGFNYWTATDENGVNNGSACSDWTVDTSGLGGTGLAHYVGRAASYYISLNCTGTQGMNRLLCLEVGAGDAQKLPSETGSLVFVTSVTGPGRLQSWADAGGNSSLAAGDAICRARAAAGKLPSPDSFVAYLSTDAVDANLRMTSPGPFVRVDGFLFSPSRAALFASDVRTGLNVTELGTYETSTAASDVWTATTSDGGNGGTNCEDWLSEASDPEDTGTSGSLESTRFNWSFVSSPLCSSEGRLFCFSNVVTLFWDNFERGNTSRWTNGTP